MLLQLLGKTLCIYITCACYTSFTSGELRSEIGHAGMPKESWPSPGLAGGSPVNSVDLPPRTLYLPVSGCARRVPTPAFPLPILHAAHHPKEVRWGASRGC